MFVCVRVCVLNKLVLYVCMHVCVVLVVNVIVICVCVQCVCVCAVCVCAVCVAGGWGDKATIVLVYIYHSN